MLTRQAGAAPRAFTWVPSLPLRVCRSRGLVPVVRVQASAPSRVLGLPRAGPRAPLRATPDPDLPASRVSASCSLHSERAAQGSAAPSGPALVRGALGPLGKGRLWPETQSKAAGCSSLKEAEEMPGIPEWLLHLDQIQRGKKKTSLRRWLKSGCSLCIG